MTNSALHSITSCLLRWLKTICVILRSYCELGKVERHCTAGQWNLVKTKHCLRYVDNKDMGYAFYLALLLATRLFLQSVSRLIIIRHFIFVWVSYSVIYALDDPGFESRQGGGIFLFSETSGPTLELTQLLIQWVPACFFTPGEGKAAGAWFWPLANI